MGLLLVYLKICQKQEGLCSFQYQEELSQVTSTDESGFIDIESNTYKQLDDIYSITEFYAGKELKQEKINSNLILNDSISVFKQLLRQKRGDYESLQGVYEEYYYDNARELMRKDYLLIQPNGKAFMIGTYRYEGIVYNLGSKFLIDFRSTHLEQKPLIYLIHKDSNDNNIYSGVFATVSESNNNIVGNTAYLHKLSEENMDRKTFFDQYGNGLEQIPLNTDRFHDINNFLDNLGKLLAGQVGNSIVSKKLQEVNLIQNNSRKVAYTFFPFSLLFGFKKWFPGQKGSGRGA